MGIFDEAKMVVFRDKEVKSIIRTRDDAIIYQKPLSGASILLTSNKNSLSINENVVLTATIPVESVTESMTNNTGQFSMTNDAYFSFTNDGMEILEDYEPISYDSYEFNLNAGSYVIEMDCTKTDARWLCMEFGSNAGHAIFIDDYPEMFNESFTLPNGLGDTIHFKLDYTPNEQKLYIDNTLVKTTNEYINEAEQSQVTFILYFWNKQRIKNLSITKYNQTIEFVRSEFIDNLTSDNHQIVGDITYDNEDGAFVCSNDYYIDYTFDLPTHNYKIAFTAKKMDGEDDYFAINISNKNGSNYGAAAIMGTYNEFFDNSFNTPSNLDTSVDVVIDITPTVQKLYINDSLVCSSNYNMSDPLLMEGANYLNFLDTFFIKDLHINESGFAKANTNGEATYTYTYPSIHSENITFQAKYKSAESNIVTIEAIQPPYIQLTIVGDTVMPYDHYDALQPHDNVYIDWGDNSALENYSSYEDNPYMSFSHVYQDNGTYTVKIYGYVTTIGGACFDDITTLTEIILSNQVTTIGDGAFGACHNLEYISIPDSVTTIGWGCFSFCEKLTSIVIPSSVTFIDDEAFNTNKNGSIDVEFQWDNANDIIEYNPNWFYNQWGSTDFSITIPYGTTQLYVDKNYPLEKLTEKVSPYASSTVRVSWTGPSGNTPVLMSLAYAFKNNRMVTHPYDNNTYELNPNNNWELTINNLPKQIDGQDVVYQWWLESLPSDYNGVQPVYNWNESNYDPTQNLTIVYLKKK